MKRMMQPGVVAAQQPARRDELAISARPGAILRTAIWFALVTGLLEVFALAVRQRVFGQVIMVSQHFVWLTPVADLLLFLVPGAVLALVAMRWPRWTPLPFVAGVFAFLGALGLVFMYPQLHRLAMLVLSLGAAVQTARLIGPRPAAFQRMVRRTTGWMFALVAVMAVAVAGTLWWKERRLLAALPAARDGQPNLILIILDTVRAASLSLYGYARPTSPELDDFARGGVVFDAAVAPSAWTLPSHATMFTGRWPHEHKADWKVPLDDTYPTLAEVLAERGYLTAGFVANTFYGSYEHGLDRGFVRYEDYRIGFGQLLNSSSLGFLIFAGRSGFSSNFLRRLINNYEYLGRKKADRINADFLSWLYRRDLRRPYFAFLNYFDAHSPYTPPAEYRRRFNEEPATMTSAAQPAAAPDRGDVGRRERDAYDASIAAQDHELGRLFSELEQRGELDNTLIIITSDHGEHLGEHGLLEHGNSLYMPLIHVPLVISFPGRVPAGGERIATPVTLRSLPATALQLLGVQDERIPGVSLPGAGNATPTAFDPVLSELSQGINTSPDEPVSRGDMKSFVLGQHHYIRNYGDNREELYDLGRDPAELQDLSAAAHAQATMAQARAALHAVIAPPAAHDSVSTTLLGARGTR